MSADRDRSVFPPQSSSRPSGSVRSRYPRPDPRIDLTALVMGLLFLGVAVLSWTGQLGRLTQVGRDGFWWVLIALGILLLVSVVRGRRER